MKSSEIKKLKGKSKEDLEHDIKEAREKLRNLKFDLMSGKVKNLKSVHEVRKQIARLMTFLRDKK